MAAEPIETGEQHMPEWGASIRWQAYSHHFDFKIREATAQPDGSVIYYPGDGSVAHTFDEGARFIDGAIKWDGCSHLNFGDGDGYLHLCGAHAFRDLTQILVATFKLAAEKIPKFDASTADLKALSPISISDSTNEGV